MALSLFYLLALIGFFFLSLVKGPELLLLLLLLLILHEFEDLINTKCP